VTPENFCYWLQGFFELKNPNETALNTSQTQAIRNHLNLVFKHSIDPSIPGDPVELQAVHDGPATILYTGTGKRC